jgi:hypothetical protein
MGWTADLLDRLQFAFGTRVLAEVGISLLAVSLFFLLFRFRPAWRDWALSSFRRIAAHPYLPYIIAGLFPVCLRLLAIPWRSIPEPLMHDEKHRHYAYLKSYQCYSGRQRQQRRWPIKNARESRGPENVIGKKECEELAEWLCTGLPEGVPRLDDAEVPRELLSTAVSRLRDLGGFSPETRELAFKLLAVDALATYAYEAAAERGDDIRAFAVEGMFALASVEIASGSRAVHD